MAFDVDAIDLDRLREVLDVNGSRRRAARLAEHLHGWGEQPHDLVRLRAATDVGRHAPEERVDAQSGGHRLERVERGQHLDCRGASPTSSSASRSAVARRSRSPGSGRPPGNPS